MPRTRCIRSAQRREPGDPGRARAGPAPRLGGAGADALAAYDAERRPSTAEIVLTNRRGGPEGVIDVIEARAPDGFDDIEAVASHAEREAIVRGYAAMAGFAREQVNRGSLSVTRYGVRVGSGEERQELARTRVAVRPCGRALFAGQFDEKSDSRRDYGEVRIIAIGRAIPAVGRPGASSAYAG